MTVARHNHYALAHTRRASRNGHAGPQAQLHHDGWVISAKPRPLACSTVNTVFYFSDGFTEDELSQ